MLLALAVLPGCQPSVQQETQALTLAPDAPALRQQQMRRFDTRDEALLLRASVGVMQDLGFQIDEATPSAGVVIGSKDRDARDSAQMAGHLALAILLAAGGVATAPAYDQSQRIRLSVITQPSPDHAATIVRVTFQRVVSDNMGRVSHVETLADPLIYQGFFDKLSQAAFLEAHEI